MPRCGKGTELTTRPNPREFFISRLVSGAAAEGHPLTDIEITYLQWSRIDDEQQQQRLHEQVQQVYGETGFEARMTELLRRAYRQDAATDPSAPRCYRENYEQLEGSDKDLELSVIVGPVLTFKPTAMTAFVLTVVGAVGVVFTLLMIMLIIRYLFWK